MDLNADLGESWYEDRIGNDEALMPYLDSCNIACGFHGGDALTMQRTIALAQKHGVNIGAHPSYPDRESFGRLSQQCPPERLEALLMYQVAALKGMVQAAGGTLHHLKVHGALYHDAAFGESQVTAQVIVRVAQALAIPLLYGPQGSHLEQVCSDSKYAFWAEGFVDRAYVLYNRLQARGVEGALIHDPQMCARQAQDLAAGRVQLTDGSTSPVRVNTLCIHGDHHGAVATARSVRQALNNL